MPDYACLRLEETLKIAVVLNVCFILTVLYIYRASDI